MTLPEAPTVQPLHKAAQRLRWFVRAFEEQTEVIEAETGNRFSVSHEALAKVFAKWLRAFEAQKPHAPDDKLAYVGFAAGAHASRVDCPQTREAANLPQRRGPVEPSLFLARRLFVRRLLPERTRLGACP